MLVESLKLYYIYAWDWRIPAAIVDMFLAWPKVYRSPYSNTLYNMQGKTWETTPEGIQRLSDHWNFASYWDLKVAKHCRTDVPVAEGTWTIAEYHDGIFHVLKSLPKVTNEEEEAFGAENWEKIKAALPKCDFSGDLDKKRSFFKNRSGEIFCRKIGDKGINQATVQFFDGNIKDIYSGNCWEVHANEIEVK